MKLQQSWIKKNWHLSQEELCGHNPWVVILLPLIICNLEILYSSILYLLFTMNKDQRREDSRILKHWEGEQ